MKIHEIINENLQQITPLYNISSSKEANIAYENLNILLETVMTGLEMLKSMIGTNNDTAWNNSIKMADGLIARFNSRIDEYLNMIKNSGNQSSLEIYIRDFEKMKNDLGYIRQMFDESINENQQYMADNGQSSAIPGRAIEKSKKQSAKSKVETLQRR
jgi:hypothetical protein